MKLPLDVQLEMAALKLQGMECEVVGDSVDYPIAQETYLMVLRSYIAGQYPDWRLLSIHVVDGKFTNVIWWRVKT